MAKKFDSAYPLDIHRPTDRNYTSFAEKCERTRLTLLCRWVVAFSVAVWILLFTTVLGDVPRHMQQILCDTPILYSRKSVSSLFCGNQAVPSPATNRQSTGLTDLVEWDEHSLFIKGQRVFIWSGEFHTWRLPVPSLWPDILEKIKASGMNAISIYVHWGLVNPSRDVFDFEGYRALEPLFDAAKDAGLWVVFRPGPYINAETTAGGLAHWATSEVPGRLRTNSTGFHEAWAPYIKIVSEIAAKNQITFGGPVIAVQVDNEFLEDEAAKVEMMVQLEKAFRSHGIVVPLTFNDAYQGKNYANGRGSVDIYGLDSYPQFFDCSHPYQWNPVVENYHDFHRDTNPRQPLYIPEFQGGAFDAYGPTAPGYDACRTLTGPDFESVFNLNLWASNVKLANIYMVYGGTSWGYLPFPGVYTSYDYGAAIKETREIGSKYTELKRQGLFLCSMPDFYKTDVVGNSTDGTVAVENSDAFVTFLRNPENGAGFYIARQANSSSTKITRFKLQVNVASQTLQIPATGGDITLSGRQSKVIVTNTHFGSSALLYSTASILFASKLAGRDTLFLYGDANQQHEASIKFTSQPSFRADTSRVKLSASNHGYTTVTFLPGIQGIVPIWESETQLVLFSDTETAGTIWAPTLSREDSDKEFSNYWQFGTNDTILVSGPYLVRSASLTNSGTELRLRGDIEGETNLGLIGLPNGVLKLYWNGERVDTDLTSTHARKASHIHAVLRPKILTGFVAPALSEWKYADSLPEVKGDYDDSFWTVANHTSTNLRDKPYRKPGPVLYACDYEFCEGAVIWRGHFDGKGDETAVRLIVNGGEAFASSVWLNDVFIGTTYGNSTNNANIVRETNQMFTFPSGAVLQGSDNIITIIQDNMGLDETEDWDGDTSKSPRGIRDYEIVGGSDFSVWRVQGKLGGYKNFPDKTRGIFNEGGLYGERAGWHLNGFDDSNWGSRSFADGLPEAKAGVGFFRTEFDLNIPEGVDVPMSFVFDSIEQPYRALLFVNGWLMGKRVANLGPQVQFPVHEGILDYRGKNAVVVALWAMENVALSPDLSIVVGKRYDGGIGHVDVVKPGWEDRGEQL